jgi:hypothetical protein
MDIKCKEWAAAEGVEREHGGENMVTTFLRS